MNNFFIFNILFIVLSNWAIGEVSKPTPIPIPSLLQSFEKVNEISQNKITNLTQKTLLNPKFISSIKNQKSVEIDSQFLLSILMNSKSKYLNLIQNDECFFYLLLENNLLRTEKGPVQNVIIRYQNDKKEFESGLIPLNDFLELTYSHKCISNKEIKGIYTKKELQNTLQKIEYTIPKNENECVSVVNDWKKNPNLPFFCKMHEIFEDAKNAQKRQKIQTSEENENVINYALSIKQKLTPFQYQYINRLCENLENPINFCDKYLNSSFWQKIVNGEKPISFFEANCRKISNKNSPLNQNDLMNCAQKLEENSDFCQYSNYNSYPSLLPKPNCNNISTALNHSILKTNYQDCPGKILNEGIVTGARMIAHLKSESVPILPENCFNVDQGNFAQMNLDAGNSAGWGMSICYDNKIEKRKSCFPIFLANVDKNSYSEGVVVGQILKKILGADDKLVCNLASDKEFNPAKLQYRTGCFLVYNSNNCTATKCPKKIIYNEREITATTYNGTIKIDLFPNNFKTEKFAFINIISDTLKKNNKQIYNMTQIKTFFREKKDGILIGVGCSEDLYPMFFKRNFLNQCTPLSFIIDGQFTKDQKIYLSIRSGIDDVHSPRIINWNLIISSIKNYQSIHPLKSWTLYGLY